MFILSFTAREANIINFGEGYGNEQEYYKEVHKHKDLLKFGSAASTVGTVPEKTLAERSKSCNCDSRPKSLGIVPFRVFAAGTVEQQNISGQYVTSSSINMFTYLQRYKLAINVSLDKSVGTVPES